MRFWFCLLITVLIVVFFSESLGFSSEATRVISCLFALAVIILRRLILFDFEAHYAKISNGTDIRE